MLEPGGELGDAREQLRRVARRLAVDLEHDVAHLDAGALGGPVPLRRRGSARRPTSSSASAFAMSARDVLRLDAEPAARDLAVADDLLEHVARERDRDREADAQRAARLREDRAVDADQIARRVDQRAAGVAGIDRGVGLDEILEPVDAEMVAAERADDART